MTYDTKCADLARAFLRDVDQDDETRVKALAQDIQDAVEQFFRRSVTREHE